MRCQRTRLDGGSGCGQTTIRSPRQRLDCLWRPIQRGGLGSLSLPAGRPRLRPLTRTPGFNEYSPQFSRNGRKLLYRRVPREETIDNNRHGEQGELVLANADGSSPVVLGKPASCLGPASVPTDPDRQPVH